MTTERRSTRLGSGGTTRRLAWAGALAGATLVVGALAWRAWQARTPTLVAPETGAGRSSASPVPIPRTAPIAASPPAAAARPAPPPPARPRVAARADAEDSAAAPHAPIDATQPAPPPAAIPMPAAAGQADARAPAETQEDAIPEDASELPPASLDDPAIRQAWLARILALSRAGQDAEARASLAEFRRRYPQAPLPPELQALAAPSP